MSLLLNFSKDSLGSNLAVLLVLMMMFFPWEGSFFFYVSYFFSSCRLFLF